MFEELYEPLPDLASSLSRIGIDRRKEPDPAFLDELVYSFQTHIPFEDIDPAYLKTPVSLAINDLYDKIVNRKRGGYCFELNCFFYTVLKDLGFNAYPCQCRVVKGADLSCAHIPLLHRGTLVSFEDRLFFVDVGYGGPSPAGWIEVFDGSKRNIKGEIFSIKKIGKWWTLGRIASSGEYEHTIQFLSDPCENVDFIPGNEYCSKNDNSVFKKMLIVNIRTENGSISLTDNTLTVTENHSVKKTILENAGELQDVLRKYFGIAL